MKYQLFDKNIFDELKKKAYSSTRKRAHHNIHTSYSEKVQKVLICLLKDTYIPPHFHKYNHQAELFVVLKGKIKLVTFNQAGECDSIFYLGDGYDMPMIEIYPNTIHTVICESEEAFILEIKQGPFVSNDCKAFPSWSIDEDDDRAKNFLKIYNK